MQSEIGIEGRMIEERRPVGLSVVLDVVEIVRVVGVVAGSEVGQVGVGPGSGIVRGLIVAVVAIGLENPWVGPMEVVHFQIVVALTVGVPAARFVAGPVSTPAAKYTRMDRTQCP